jgi:hypothetical protein
MYSPLLRSQKIFLVLQRLMALKDTKMEGSMAFNAIKLHRISKKSGSI